MDVACQQFMRGYSYLNQNLGAIDPLYELIESISEELQDDMSSRGCRMAFEAIALAHMGIQNRSEKVLALARNKYCSSLGFLRKALTEACESKDIGRLLMAVRLCTGYEFMVCGNPFETGWARHMEGQLSLAKALMPYVGGSRIYQSLFLAAFFSIAIVRCYARTALCLSRDDITGIFGDVEDLEVSLALLTFDVLDLRARASKLTGEQEPTAQTVENAIQLLDHAGIIASQLRGWRLIMATQHPIRSFTVTRTADKLPLEECEFWLGPMQSYESMHLANLNNVHRSWTIYTHAAMIQIQTWLQSRPEAAVPPWIDAAYDFQMMQSAIDGICADAPYYLGLRNGPDGLTKAAAEDLSLKGGGHSSYWFWLATAVGVEVLDVRQRLWILGRLRFIGDIYGHRWAAFISRHPPKDIILGAVDDERRAIYVRIPGWPQADDSTASEIPISLSETDSGDHIPSNPLARSYLPPAQAYDRNDSDDSP